MALRFSSHISSLPRTSTCIFGRHLNLEIVDVSSGPDTLLPFYQNYPQLLSQYVPLTASGLMSRFYFYNQAFDGGEGVMKNRIVRSADRYVPTWLPGDKMPRGSHLSRDHVTDLHQQGADHRVDPAHRGDDGHLVPAQHVGLQCLGADLQVHLTCGHTEHILRDGG